MIFNAAFLLVMAAVFLPYPTTFFGYLLISSLVALNIVLAVYCILRAKRIVREIGNAPRRGDTVIQSGCELVVLSVEDGEVHYCQWREGADGGWDPEHDCPKGYVGHVHVPLELWRKGTASARIPDSGKRWRPIFWCAIIIAVLTWLRWPS